jgi:hypothetical protein
MKTKAAKFSALIIISALAASVIVWLYVWSQRNNDLPHTAATSSPAPHSTALAAVPTIGDTIDQFLQHHWQHPLPPQGKPPAHFSHSEASLDPQQCGSCHVVQFNDWKKSLHSHTMGPGILWQLRLMNQEQANACLNCHAPLAEQKALLAMEHQWPNAPSAQPPAYVPPQLGHDGLTCAGCHVRQHQRFGPEPRTEINSNALPHNGFTVSAAFEDSRFCASCHQFPDDGPRTAGKLREDTLQQWQASNYPQKNQQCQSCHMPDRKHQWQGIHSPDMVKTALSFSLTRDGDKITTAITNSGAGHHFPTYMVPKIHIQLLLVGANKKRTPLGEHIIGWQVDVSLAQEIADTRIPAGQTHTFSASLPAGSLPNDTIELRVLVQPREHYERTFLSVLEQADKLDATTLNLLQSAYDEAVATHFEWTPFSKPLSSIDGNQP